MVIRGNLAELQEVFSLTGEQLRSEREEIGLCNNLLSVVAGIRDELIESTSESERLQQLAPEALALLKKHQLLNLRLMEEMGGLEASLATQCHILAALAEADSATAWCSMVHNNGVGTLAAYFPDSAIKQIFKDGIPIVSFVAAMSGTATPVDGGFCVNGAWRFCSGFSNADWIVCGARVEGENPQNLLIVVPKEDVILDGEWNVLGLRGTGSVNFSLTNYFVPSDHAIDNDNRVQLRGSRLYGRPGILIAVYEHAAFAWGTGRRALRLLAEQANRLGPNHPLHNVVASELGQLSVELEAAASLMLHYYTVLETFTANETADPGICAHGRAIATYITEVAARCTDTAVRRAGTRAGMLPNAFEQTLRDIRMAQAHVLVTDANYTLYGDALLT